MKQLNEFCRCNFCRYSASCKNCKTSAFKCVAYNMWFPDTSNIIEKAKEKKCALGDLVNKIMTSKKYI